jgi:hypothetical protein
MAFKRDENRGAIVQAILNLREAVYMTPEMMTNALAEYGVDWKMLQEHRNFVEGIWSGFTWPTGQEATFWRMLITYRDVQVVAVTTEEVPCQTQPNMTPV